jgi:hypothetical protein
MTTVSAFQVVLAEIVPLTDMSDANDNEHDTRRMHGIVR